ncbi:MAG TPA: hypothetical protein VGR69_07450 [Candidatus Rubrimentiphilum sp.]|nr:hypothetical protein [Candidatus Rubrimentiphilum sp.]
MPNVELQKSLNVPAVPARDCASAILHDIEKNEGEWAGFALHLHLGALGLPDVGYIAVPIKLTIKGEETEPRHQIKFTFRSRRSPELFPEFDGAIGIDSTGPSASQIWLAGKYELPLHGFGRFFDQVVARKAAEQTLQNLLNDLADAIAAWVEKREIAQARYRIFGSSD